MVFLEIFTFSLSLLSDSAVINTIWQIVHALECYLVPEHRDGRSSAPPAIAPAKPDCCAEPSRCEVAVTHDPKSSLCVAV